MTPGRALVTDGDSLAGLAVVRSLGRAGWSVDVAAPRAGSLGARSRYCARSLTHPDPATDVAGFRSWILGLVGAGTYGLVVPVTDWSIVPLLPVREQLEARCKLAIAPTEALLKTLSKSETAALARSVGVPTPRTWRVTTAGEWDAVRAEVPAEAVIKADASKSWDDAGGLHHATTYSLSAAELDGRVRHFLRFGAVLVQERVSGDGVGVGALAADGEALVLFQYRRLHEVPVSGGASSYRRSEPLSPAVADLSRRLLRGLRWHGVAMIELKVDARTGVAHLIEINGRFWGSLHLAVASGADFPRYLAELLLSGRRDPPADYRVGVRSRTLAGELAWAKDVLVQRSPPGVASYPPRWHIARDSARFVHPDERMDTLKRDDPVPGLVQLRRLAEFELRGVWRFLRRRWILERMVRTRADRAALDDRLGRVRRVVFLCSGNIIRSAWGAAWLRSQAPALAVDSAGLWARDGTAAHPMVLARAAERGLDLSGHRSQTATAAGLADADLVVVMDVGHLLSARRLVDPSRVLLIGVLAPDGPLEIPDPVDDGAAAISACLDRVEACVAALIAG